MNLLSFQESIVTSRGYPPSSADVLRTAHLWYPDEPLFRSIPIHVRYNRARRGSLEPGDAFDFDRALANLWTGEREPLHVPWTKVIEDPRPESSEKKRGFFTGLWRRGSPVKSGTARTVSSNGMTVVVAGSYS